MAPEPVSADTNAPSGSTNDRKLILWVAVPTALACVVCVGLYIYAFWRQPLSRQPSDWGTFGDYFGGALGVIFGAATVWIIWATYRTQRRELIESQKAIRDQLQESRNQYLVQVTSLRVEEFWAIYRRVTELHDSLASGMHMQDIINRVDSLRRAFVNDPAVINKAASAWFEVGRRQPENSIRYVRELRSWLDLFEQFLFHIVREDMFHGVYEALVRSMINPKIKQLLWLHALADSSGEFKRLLERHALSGEYCLDMD